MIEVYLALGILVVLLLIVLALSIYVVQQWEKGAVLRFGQIKEVVDPGLHFKVPAIDTVRKVDLRTQTIDLMGQSAITRDNISVGINGGGEKPHQPPCPGRRGSHAHAAPTAG